MRTVRNISFAVMLVTVFFATQVSAEFECSPWWNASWCDCDYEGELHAEVTCNSPYGDCEEEFPNFCDTLDYRCNVFCDYNIAWQECDTTGFECFGQCQCYIPE